MEFFWWLFEIEVPQELEESLIWKLKSIGINGYSIEYSLQKNVKQQLRIWLPSYEWKLKDREKLIFLLEPLAQTFGFSLPKPRWSKVQNEDWNLTWKEYWHPDPLGETLLILPAWMEVPEAFSRRRVVRIDPGSAFGTGSHPSTRLCLEELERNWPVGMSVADLGCGSGILSLTSFILGASNVFAADIDSLAVRSTQNNFLLNNIPNSSFAIFKGSIDQLCFGIGNKKVDLLLCNILAPVIKEVAFGFEQMMGLDGRVILSGILIQQVEDLSSFLEDLGWFVVKTLRQGDWALIEVSRKAYESSSGNLNQE